MTLDLELPDWGEDPLNLDEDTSERRSWLLTCGGCDYKSNALAVAHCSTCHETFTRVTGFDLHRAGGACLGSDELAERGMQQRDDGLWFKPLPEDERPPQWRSREP